MEKLGLEKEMFFSFFRFTEIRSFVSSCSTLNDLKAVIVNLVKYNSAIDLQF